MKKLLSPLSLHDMARRSARLESTGYYNSDGTPSISYKELLYKIFKRRQYHSGSFRSKTINPRINNDSLFSDTHSIDSHLSDINSHNVMSQGNSHTDSRGRTMIFLKIFVFVFMLPLCFGLVYLRSIILVSRPTDSSDSPTSLDQDLNAGDRNITKQLQELQDELLKLKKKIKYLLPDADTWPNFALESLGAKVLFQQTSKPYLPKDKEITIFGIPIWASFVSPMTVIQGHTPLRPGCCWAFAGGRGHLSIALSYPVAISHVTLGHISKSLSPTGAIMSAPKEFSVYGMETVDGEWTKLGTFLYDQDGGSVQTFKIPDHKAGVFSYVKLQVESNWGHPDYSCLYSFKVHGNLAD